MACNLVNIKCHNTYLESNSALQVEEIVNIKDELHMSSQHQSTLRRTKTFYICIFTVTPNSLNIYDAAQISIYLSFHIN